MHASPFKLSKNNFVRHDHPQIRHGLGCFLPVIPPLRAHVLNRWTSTPVPPVPLFHPAPESSQKVPVRFALFAFAFQKCLSLSPVAYAQNFEALMKLLAGRLSSTP